MTGNLIKWFEIKSFRQRYSAGWVYGLRATKHSKNPMTPCRLLPQRSPGQPTERVSKPGCSAVGLQPPLSPFGAEPLMRAVSASLGCCGKVLESIKKGHYHERQVLFRQAALELGSRELCSLPTLIMRLLRARARSEVRQD